MAWDERRFGLEYDLDDYAIVAVDDFTMGAMEVRARSPGRGALARVLLLASSAVRALLRPQCGGPMKCVRA